MRDAERGFVLTAVLVTFLVIEVMVIGVLAVVMSDLHGAVGHELAMQSVHVAEAGMNYAAAQLVARASAAVSDDERYAGDDEDMGLKESDGSTSGTFRVTVRCAHPDGAVPPACQDNLRTAKIDERNLRVIIASGFVPSRPGRARRQIEAVVRRYTAGAGDIALHGICGRERVDLGSDTTVTADVGSNGDVFIDGPRRTQGTVRERLPRGPTLGPSVEAEFPEPSWPGLTGLYTWRVTFVTFQGEESGGSPPSQPLLLTAQYGRLTSVPIGDGAVTRRRIYRTPQGSPRGPWLLVGEILDNSTQEYTDTAPDEALRHRMPGAIGGIVTAGGAVTCSRGCANQVDGQVRSNVRDVVCPAFLPPPAEPGSKPPPNPIIQTDADQTVRWSVLRVDDRQELTIRTLSVQNAQLHIHLSSLVLGRGARLAVTGAATVYFHLSGPFVLGPDAMFGVSDSGGRLVRPSDRIQVLSRARDPSFTATGAASVRLDGNNRVSGLVFAPDSNIFVDRAAHVRGALYGRHIRINRSSDIVADPVEGLGSERSGVRPTAFQYVLRWYDNPNPGP
ncbi:MAG: hypothetical protein ACRDIC_17225 [bacterium]